MDAVLSFVPGEERVQYNAMTGRSLFSMGQTNIKHKILAIAEEDGAHRAKNALKLLQSEGELTIASTGSDPQTGNLVTQEYRVEGPMSLFMTTTAIRRSGDHVRLRLRRFHGSSGPFTVAPTCSQSMEACAPRKITGSARRPSRRPRRVFIRF